jgi:hypothetical protein
MLFTGPFDPELWALQAAYQDSSYLISPNARVRALKILMTAPAHLTDTYVAAIGILQDGGEQQGSHEGPYHGPEALRRWSKDMNTLKRFLEGVKYHLDVED